MIVSFQVSAEGALGGCVAELAGLCCNHLIEIFKALVKYEALERVSMPIILFICNTDAQAGPDYHNDPTSSIITWHL